MGVLKKFIRLVDNKRMSYINDKKFHRCEFHYKVPGKDILQDKKMKEKIRL